MLEPALSATLAGCRPFLIDSNADICVAVEEVNACILLGLIIQYLLNSLSLVSIVTAHHLLPYGVVRGQCLVALMDLQILIQVALDDRLSTDRRNVASLAVAKFTWRRLAWSSALVDFFVELHRTRVRHIRRTNSQIIPLANFSTAYARHKR